mgnify:CR=1 FL=1
MSTWLDYIDRLIFHVGLGKVMLILCVLKIISCVVRLNVRVLKNGRLRASETKAQHMQGNTTS